MQPRLDPVSPAYNPRYEQQATAGTSHQGFRPYGGVQWQLGCGGKARGNRGRGNANRGPNGRGANRGGHAGGF